MECPQCAEEPVKVFGRWGSGVDLWKNLKGYVRCINCDILLKMKFGRPFWVSLTLLGISFTVALLSVLVIFLAFDYNLFDPSLLAGWFSWVILGSSIGTLVFFLATSYTAVLCLQFKEAEIKH